MKAKWTLLLLVLVLVLAGCTQQGTPNPDPIDEDVGIIRIGAFGPLTGPVADLGEQIRQGVELAVKHKTEEGIEINGKPYSIQVIWGDTESKTEVGVSAVEKAILVDNIDVGLGFLHSHVFLRVMDIFQKYEVPALGACCSATSIYERIAEENMEYVFHFSPTNRDFAETMIKAIDQGWGPTKIGILMENNDSGRNLTEFITELYPTINPNAVIVYQDYVDVEATEVTPELTKLKNSGAEVVYTSLVGAQASAVVEQWGDLQVPAVLAHFGATVAAQDFIDEHPNMESSIILNRWWPGPYSSISEKVLADFKERYGKDPTNFSIQAYDATIAVIDALKIAGTVDRKALRDALANNEFEGVWGLRNFTSVEEGQRAPYPDLAIVQVQDGKKIPIWPEAIKEGTLIVPPPWPWQ